MAFPVIASVSSGVFPIADTEHNLPLPTGSVVGSHLVVFVAEDATTDVIFAHDRYVTSQEESDGYLIYSPSASATVAFVIFRVTGSSGIDVSTTDTGSSANPDSPSLTTSGGDIIWASAIGWDGSNTHSSFPTNYSDNQYYEISDDPSEGIAIAVSTRSLNATTENPGTHTLAGSSPWGALTVAILPGNGGGSGAVTSDPTSSGLGQSSRAGSGAITNDPYIAGSGAIVKVRFVNGQVLFPAPNIVAFSKDCCCGTNCCSNNTYAVRYYVGELYDSQTLRGQSYCAADDCNIWLTKQEYTIMDSYNREHIFLLNPQTCLVADATVFLGSHTYTVTQTVDCGVFRGTPVRTVTVSVFHIYEYLKFQDGKFWYPKDVTLISGPATVRDFFNDPCVFEDPVPIYTPLEDPMPESAPLLNPCAAFTSSPVGVGLSIYYASFRPLRR